MLTPADMPAGYRLVRATATEVVIEDDWNPLLGIEADIDPSGAIVFLVQAVDPRDGSRGAVRGRVLFDLVMQHFGTAARAVRGIWSDGTNLKEFNRLTGAGVGPAEAAVKTWTGRQAARHGFTTATAGQRIGSPGRYGLAEFAFTR